MATAVKSINKMGIIDWKKLEQLAGEIKESGREPNDIELLSNDQQMYVGGDVLGKINELITEHNQVTHWLHKLIHEKPNW